MKIVSWASLKSFEMREGFQLPIRRVPVSENFNFPALSLI